MKTFSPATLAAFVMLGTSTAFASIAEGGVALYSIELSQSEATLGETVNVDVWLQLDAQGGAFSGLAVANFDIMAADPVGPTGVISNRTLAPAWMALGDAGAVSDDDILGIQAGQFPVVETGTELLLYSFDYTVDDATERTIDFDVAWSTPVTAFGSSIFDVQEYLTLSSGPAQLAVVPAPGAIALLGLAGLTARRRRRRTATA